MREPEMTQELQAELHQGVLVRFFGGFYVAADADGQEYTLRCPKKFRHQRLSPLVGDAVRFTPGQGEEEGWLVEILPRKTECIRPPVANVTLLLVSICPSPEPDLLLVDRLLARAKKQGMKTALIVGKCDIDGGKLLSQMQEEYRGADCPVLGVSARNKEGLDGVRALMRGEDCCCLAGQSGVGKSTLLNALLDLQLETGEISEKIQRGKNTTRYAQLLIHDGAHRFCGGAAESSCAPKAHCCPGAALQRSAASLPNCPCRALTPGRWPRLRRRGRAASAHCRSA